LQADTVQPESSAANEVADVFAADKRNKAAGPARVVEVTREEMTTYG